MPGPEPDVTVTLTRAEAHLTAYAISQLDPRLLEAHEVDRLTAVMADLGYPARSREWRARCA